MNGPPSRHAHAWDFPSATLRLHTLHLDTGYWNEVSVDGLVLEWSLMTVTW